MAIRQTRRTVLKAASALATASILPTGSYAQSEPLRLGVLTALTGAGGADGPRMLKAMQLVADEVNAAGGVLGRKIELVVEDDQTNPEAAVRAARKLIEVNKVPVLMGTWASAVTSAVAPVCWESKEAGKGGSTAWMRVEKKSATALANLCTGKNFTVPPIL